MARKIAITNQKGGVGKTTAALGLAAGLRKKDKKSLLIDLDPQGNASVASGLIIEAEGKTIKDLLAEQGNASDYIIAGNDIDIIPSNNALKDIEIKLLEKRRGYDTLKETLRPIEYLYDYIILDCPPSINVFTKNALSSSDEFIIPVDVGYFSMVGLKQILEDIDHMKEEINPNLILLGVLISKFDKRTSLSHQVLEILKSSFPGQIFETVIRMNIDIVRSQIAQKNIFSYNARSMGAQDFLSLTEEIIND
jgi:chromosome partitioning protein